MQMLVNRDETEAWKNILAMYDAVEVCFIAENKRRKSCYLSRQFL